MTLLVAITLLLLVDDFHLRIQLEILAILKRVIVITDVKNRKLFDCFYKDSEKTKLASCSVCDDCFTATKRNYLQHFYHKPYGTNVHHRLALSLQVLHYKMSFKL